MSHLIKTCFYSGCDKVTEVEDPTHIYACAEHLRYLLGDDVPAFGTSLDTAPGPIETALRDQLLPQFGDPFPEDLVAEFLHRARPTLDAADERASALSKALRRQLEAFHEQVRSVECDWYECDEPPCRRYDDLLDPTDQPEHQKASHDARFPA